MAENESGSLQIGVFSRLTRISPRMLRHYQQEGLLVPAWTDPFSGYRYYRSDQLKHAGLICLLRDAGFGITDMRRFLDQRDDPGKLESLIREQQSRLATDRERVEQRIATLARLGDYLKGTPMNFNVTEITLPAMHIAALRKTIDSYQDESTLWHEFMPLLAASGAIVASDGLCGATFYDQEYREADVDVSVWLQLDGGFSAAAPLECQALPEQRVVTARLLGAYDSMPHTMPQVILALGGYIAEHRLKTGPMFNIYRVSPAQDPNPDNWVTDVCFPILADQ